MSTAPSRPPEDAFAETVSRHVAAALRKRAKALLDRGRSIADLGSPAEVAAQMLAAVPDTSAWSEALGPVYRTPQVRKLLGGVSRQALEDRVRRHTLLGLRTADGVIVYPKFQFDERHAVLGGLADVLRVLRASGVDDWTLAGWLVARRDGLGGRSPVEWLRAGEDLETLLAVARDAAARFAR
jgi:hypothetical protein